MSDSIETYPIIDALCGIDTASPQITQYTDGFSKIKFLLGKSLDNYVLMIITDINGHVEIVTTDGENLIKETDPDTGETALTWNIGSEVSASHGVVIYQIVGYLTDGDDTISTWYSKEGRLVVTESISTTSHSAEIIGSKPNLITRLILETETTRNLCEALSLKSDTIEAGAEVNVQSDWQETNPESDAFIHGKPDINGLKSELEDRIDVVDDEASRGIDDAKSMAGNVGLALDVHRNNEDEEVLHLTSEEKANVGDIPTVKQSILVYDSRIKNTEEGLWGVESAIKDLPAIRVQTQENANDIVLIEKDVVTQHNEISAVRAVTEGLTALPQTEVPSVLKSNTAYNFGTKDELTLAFPSEANDGDVIYVTFNSMGQQATNLIVGTSNLHLDFDLVPEHGYGYELYCKYIDGFWLVKYSDYSPNAYADDLDYPASPEV